MEKVFETERLIIRPADPEKDAAAFFEFYSNAQAMRFMSTPPHDNPDQTHNEMQLKIATPGAHLWAICLKGTDKAIGEVHKLGQTRVPGLGYIIHPDYWGQGITVEACRAALNWLFAQGDDRMELWIDRTNLQSRRVAEKLGFTLRGQFAQRYHKDAYHHYKLVYGVLASEWQGEKSPSEDMKLFRAEPVFRVNNLPESVEFYRDKLGFNVDFIYGDPPYYSIVSHGEWSGDLVSIHLSQSAEPKAIESAGHLLIFMGTGLDKLYEHYKANGVTILAPPEDKPWGMREFMIEDCNGYRLLFGG